MSANLCSVRTINALASFAQIQGIDLCLNNGDVLSSRLNPQAVAKLLLDANMASLRARYPRDYMEDRVIKFAPVDLADLDPVVILKTANYFNYQSCETDGYYESDAAAMVRHIITNAIRAVPAYAAAPWGLDGVEPAPVWLKETQERMERATPLQRSILDMCFPTGAVDLEEKPAPQPTPVKQPTKKQPKPNDDQQPDGPF